MRNYCVLLMGLPWLVAGCEKPGIELRTPSGEDYHGKELATAVQTFVSQGRAPEAYLQLAKAVHRMRPTMDATVAAQAELSLVSLALDPIEVALRATDGVAAESLATTVWPVGLQAAVREDTVTRRAPTTTDPYWPLVGETSAAYVERLCGTALKAECQDVVADYQPAIVGRVAIHRFMTRAVAAVGDCVTCGGDPAWQKVVSRWDALDSLLTDRSARAEQLGSPLNWPVAGKGSSDVLDRATLQVVFDKHGEVTIDGVRVATRDRIAVLRSQRGAREVTLRAPPDARSDEVRALVAAICATGALRVGIAARRPVYPWQPRVYWVSTVNGAKLPDKWRGQSLQVALSLIDEVAPPGTAKID